MDIGKKLKKMAVSESKDRSVVNQYNKKVEPEGKAGSIRFDTRQNKVSLTKDDETDFQTWYAKHAKRLGLDKNPDHPLHYYDYRAAYKAGAVPDKTGHWPSTFKQEGHPRLIADGIDTRTGKSVKTVKNRAVNKI